MSEKDDGGPAFPRPAGNTGPCDSAQYNHGQRGMTLRDYFAAAALQGMLAWSAGESSCEEFAQVAYEHADAMLAERGRKA